MEYFKILIQSQVGNEIILDPIKLDDTYDIREWAKLGSNTSNAILNQVKTSPKRIYIIGDYVKTDKLNIIQNVLLAQRHYIIGDYVYSDQKASIYHFNSIRNSIGQSIDNAERKLWGKMGILKSTIKLNTNPPVQGLAPLSCAFYKDKEKFNGYSVIDLDTKIYHKYQRWYQDKGWVYNPIIMECLVTKSIYIPNKGILTGHLITVKLTNSITQEIYKPYWSRTYDTESIPIIFR